MKSFTLRKGVELTLTAILVGTLAYGTVHAEGQTVTYQAIDKAANIDNILSSEFAKEPKKELNEKEQKRKKASGRSETCHGSSNYQQKSSKCHGRRAGEKIEPG